MFIISLSILSAADAHAQSAASLLQQAEKASSLARFQQAIRLLKRAKAKAQPEQEDGKLLARIHFQLGLNYAVMEQHKKARKAFTEALRLDPELTPDPTLFKPSIARLFAEVQESLRGELMISTARPGVKVLVDGKERGEAPLTLSLPVGSHEVVLVSGDGSRTKPSRVVIAVGQTAALNPQLLAGEHPSEKGPAALAEGNKPGLSLAPPDEQRPHRAWSRTLGFILVGAGGASLISGAVLGWMVKSKKEEYEDGLRNGEAYLDLADVLDSAKRFQDGEYATLIAGGVLAAAGAGLLLWSFLGPDADRSPTRATLTPVLGRGRCGILGEIQF